MNSVRQWPRRTALAGLALLAAPLLVVTTMTAPAHAATGTITEPPSGQTYTSASTLIIKARIRRGLNDTGRVAMTLQLPGSASEHEIDDHSGGATGGGDYDLQFTYDPGCPSFPGISCTGRPAPNGTHTIRLRGTSSAVERTFVTRVPPRKPTGVNATATGQRQVTVRWDRGNEPDLAGYDLYTNGDTVVARGIAVDRNEYVVDYPESGYEGEKTFYVVAQRKTCPTCGDTLASPRSDTAAARLEAPPPPPPSPDPTPSEEPSTSPGNPDGGAPEPSASASSGSGGTGGTGGNTGGTGGTGSSASPSAGSSPGSGSGTGGGGGASAGPSGSARPSGSASPSARGRVSAPVLAQRQAFAQMFRNFSPKLGAPKLPPLPDFADLPELAEEEGTYEESLDFGEQDIEELVASEQGGGQRSVVEEFVTTAFEGRKLWSSIGWSLVLFLIAGHLRRWLNAAQHD